MGVTTVRDAVALGKAFGVMGGLPAVAATAIGFGFGFGFGVIVGARDGVRLGVIVVAGFNVENVVALGFAFGFAFAFGLAVGVWRFVFVDVIVVLLAPPPTTTGRFVFRRYGLTIVMVLPTTKQTNLKNNNPNNPKETPTRINSCALPCLALPCVGGG